MSDCTQLNIGTGANGSFSMAADAAFNTTLSPAFTPYANNLFFIHGAFIFEDVGVTAYQVCFVLAESPPDPGASIHFQHRVAATAAAELSASSIIAQK